MSRIVVIGGHGRTGFAIVGQLVAAGHNVVATIRNPRHMADMVKAGAETFVLDLESSTGPEFATMMMGADAVVFAAGSAEGEASALDRTGTLKTVRAAKKVGVKRYLTVSALGATTETPPKWLQSAEMKDYYKAKRAANKHVHDSGLDWTIIEPSELTDGKATGKITAAQDGVDAGKIARADVAATVVAALATPATIGKTFQITGGKTAIKTALSEASRAEPAEPVAKRPAAKKAVETK